MTEATPDIDIRPEHWKIVARILAEHLAEYEIRAFGSRARHTAKRYSDLDLAVMTETPLSLPVLAAISTAFEESNLPWSVDLLDWASTSDTFRQLIKQESVVVQRAETRPQQITTPPN